MDFLSIKKELEERDVELDAQQCSLSWTVPTQPHKGLLTSSDSFRLAKELQLPPAEIASKLSTKLNRSLNADTAGIIFKAEGPFINVYLSDHGVSNLFSNIHELTDPHLPKDGRRVMFEYIGANVAKQLHVGHMRNLNIGEALRRILSLRYPNLMTDNHWGDWGVQFGVLLWAFKEQVNEEQYKENPIKELQRLYVWGNAQEELIDDWDKIVRAEFKKLESGDKENTELWREFLRLSKLELKKDLELFNVPQTDLEQGESYYESWMKQLTRFCDEHKLWKIEGKARYVDYAELTLDWGELKKDDKQFIKKLGRAYFISSQGYTTYVFRDVAARLQWAHEHNIELALTLTDNRQEHNFNQAFSYIAYLASKDQFKQEWGFATAKRLRLNNLKHIGYGRLSLTTGDLSSRTGNNLLLRDAYESVYQSVMDQFDRRGLTKDKRALRAVTVAALKWQDLKTDPNTDVIINPDEIISFEGDTGVYQLYTVVRLHSILKKNDYFTVRVTDPQHTDEYERRLLEKLISLQSYQLLASSAYDVSTLVNELGKLSREVNHWYEHNRIQDASGDRRQAMLNFVLAMYLSIENNLKLLGIDTVKKL